MKKNLAERLEYLVGFSSWGLIPLHMYIIFLDFIHGIDKSYGYSDPVRTCELYVLAAVYLLIVLGGDAFMLWQRDFALSRVLRRYWGSSFAVLTVVLLLHISASDDGGMAAVLCLLYSPFPVLGPLLELLKISTHASLIAVGAFCLLNWAVCRFAVKEEAG